MYEGWQADGRKAAENWHVIGDVETDGVHYVEAEAKTGSRYVVVVSRLPLAVALREGGDVLVTVAQPWQAAYVMQSEGWLDLSYVGEKFTGGRWFESGRLHGGDLIALYLTMGRALNRPVDASPYLSVDESRNEA